MTHRPLPLSSASRRGFASLILLALLVAGWVAASGEALAQEAGTLSGRVRSGLSDRFVANAFVDLVETGQTVRTDEYGTYRFFKLPAGTYTVRATFAGHAPATVSVELAGAAADVPELLLLPARQADEGVIDLEEFRVEAREESAAAIAQQEQRYAPNLKTVLDSDAFGDVTEGNVGEFIKNMPGVSVDYVAADVRSISVRGFQDVFTPVTVDGNRMASASSSTSNRTFELEQVSINNVARIEVVKVPTPAMGADSLGGAVNLVSRNAFERSKREIKYRSYLSLNSENLVWGQTPGPWVEDSWKIRPGFDLTYSEPINANLGIVLNGLYSNQFNEQHRSRNRWDFTSTGFSSANPYFRRYELQDGPKATERSSLGLNGDWRIAPGTVLSAGAQWNTYDGYFGNRNITWNVGSTPTQYGPDFTVGRARAADIVHGGSFRRKFGDTTHLTLNLKHVGPTWSWDGGGFWSRSTNTLSDTDEGYFENVGTRARNLTMSFADVGDYYPGTITVLDANNAPFNAFDASQYRLRSARSRPFDSTDTQSGGQANVRRTFQGLAVPVHVQAGLAVRRQEREALRQEKNYTFVGADRIAESADDSIANYLDPIYTGVTPGFGWPGLSWPDFSAIYRLFRTNPNYFLSNPEAEIAYAAQNDELVEETVSAGYLMAEATLMRSRLNVLGGIRYERTQVRGEGYLNNPDAFHPDPITRANLQWVRRGNKVSRTYDDYYPSLHFVYTITDTLSARFSYAKTLGRPNFAEIIPGTIVDEDSNAGPDDPGGRITAKNPGLQPWEGQNFDLTLEWYGKGGASAAAGVFRKDVGNFFGKVARTVTDQDLVDFNLSPDYLGWNLETTINAGDARITGAEFSLNQPLTFLPEWLRGFTFSVNGTFLHLEGPNSADFKNFIKQTGNVGLTWSRRPLDIKLKVNHRGRQQLDPVVLGNAADRTEQTGFEWYAPRTTVDLNVEWRFRRSAVFFVSTRNIFNREQDRQIYAADTPVYARTERREEYGIQFAVGFKGTF